MIKPPLTPSWRVSYGDGSANIYRLRSEPDGAAFEYIPVTREQSSSGMYSGGEPRTGRLDAGQVDAMWQQIRALELAPELRADARNKMTGAFTVEDPAGSREFIVNPGPLLRAWDTFLATL